MKIGVLLFTLILLSIPMIGICQDAKLPPEWTFDKKDEIKNWGGLNQLKPLEISTVKDNKGQNRTIVLTVSTGTDPYVFPDGDWNGFIPDVEPFEGKDYNIIYIGVRVNVSSSWQIYYVTDQDAAYTERQQQTFPVNVADDFQDIQFKMETGGWKEEEIIKGFRLDPGTISGVEAEIDYISLRGVPGGATKAVNYNEKLATTWSAIKR
jgi:hypothetical protein